MENKRKHLEFIQTVINRMAGNSFLIKGWAVTLVAALFALAAKDANINYILVSFFPVITFWVLNGYFLSQERQFRSLYDHVRKLKNDEINFSMDVSKFNTCRNSWASAMLSQTLLLFYLSLITVMLIIMYFIH